MTKKCLHCGRELQCIGGYFSPVFESCNCGGEERARARSLANAERLRREIDEENQRGGCTCGLGDYFRCPMHAGRNIAMMSCR